MPFWLIVTAFLALAGCTTINSTLDFYPLSSVAQNVATTMKSELINSYNHLTIFMFLPFYSFFCGIYVFRYLYKKKLCTTIHVLPLKRDCFYITNTLSGLCILILPFVITAIILTVYLAILGFAFTYLYPIFLLLIGYCFIFFSLAVFTAMITGYLLAAPIVYFFLNFGAVFISIVIHLFTSTFYYGLSSLNNINTFFSPFTYLYRHFSLTNQWYSHGNYDKGYVALILYSIVAVILLVISFFLYKRRHLEKHGDPVVIKKLQTVFLYAGTFLGGSFIAFLLFGLFDLTVSNNLYMTTSNMVTLSLLFLLGSCISYYIMNMLLKKTIRVFRGTSKGIIIYSTCAILGLLLIKLDVLGLENYIPDSKEIKSVQFEMGFYPLIGSDESTIEDIIAIHKSMLEEKDAIITQCNKKDSQTNCNYVRFVYTLDDEETVTRDYYLPDFWPDSNYPQAITNILEDIKQLFSKPDLMLQELDKLLSTDYSYCFDTKLYDAKTDTVTWNTYMDDTTELNAELIEAVKKDIADGNLTYSIFEGDDSEALFIFNIYGTSFDTDYNSDLTYYVTKKATNTLKALKK